MIGAGAAILGSADTIYFEPRHLELTFNVVRCGFPEERQLRVLHLTDFHASQFVTMKMIEHSIDLGLAQKPDLICLTGDFITFQSGFDEEHYVALLRRLSRAAPTFAVLGNHDGNRWAIQHGGFGDHAVVERMLGASKISLLHNRAVRLQVNKIEFALVGIADLWSEEIDANKAFQELDFNKPIILLAHNPDSKDTVKPYPWNLMLSGHTHGGQVILPFEGPAFAPVKDLRFVAGLEAWNGRQIFVNRGVGNLGGVRFRCRPEVSILTLI